MTTLLGIVEASKNQPNKALDKIWRSAGFKAMLNAPDLWRGTGGELRKQQKGGIGGGRVGVGGGGSVEETQGTRCKLGWGDLRLVRLSVIRKCDLLLQVDSNLISFRKFRVLDSPGCSIAKNVKRK